MQKPFCGVQGQGGLAAIRGEKTLAELAEQFDVRPTRSHSGTASFWRARLASLGKTKATSAQELVDVKTLHAKIGALALEEALSRNEKTEIFNTDQGSQFTREALTGRLKENGITISMDCKGRWRDNVFVERIWKSIKYEEVYLHAYASVSEARTSIGRYLEFYNSIRPHSSLKALTPDQVYLNRLPVPLAA